MTRHILFIAVLIISVAVALLGCGKGDETVITDHPETIGEATATPSANESAVDWTDLTASGVPEPIQGTLVKMQEVNDGDAVSVKQLVISNMQKGAVNQWINQMVGQTPHAPEEYTVTEQPEDYAAEFQERLKAAAGSALVSAEEEFNSCGLTVEGKKYYIVTAGDDNNEVEFVYGTSMAVLTILF